MCDEEAFAKIRDAIDELQKADAVQSEQIKTLFHTTEKQGAIMLGITKFLVAAVVSVLILTVLALVFGALGERGFNAITHAAPTMIGVNEQPDTFAAGK